MTKRTDPELRAFLGSFHDHRVRIYLTNGQDTAGTVNTTVWSRDGDLYHPEAIYLTAPEDPDLVAVLIPWHAVAAIGRLLPPRPGARGDELVTAGRAAQLLADVPPIDLVAIPADVAQVDELTDEQAERLAQALRAVNDDEPDQ